MNNIVIPDGFERHFRRSPFTDPWEPLYSKRTDKAVIVGLRLAKPHTNAHGLIHGGSERGTNRTSSHVRSMVAIGESRHGVDCPFR
jgi:hypothetical protein